MWHKDDPLPMSMDQWRERERKRERRSLIIVAIMATLAACVPLIGFIVGLLLDRRFRREEH